MNKHIEAVFENGVFRPMTKPQLPEHQSVHLIIEEMNHCSEEFEIIAMQGKSFEFLNSSAEDIYTPSDGKPPS